MPNMESFPAFAQYQLQRFDFAQHNVAISQAQVALFLNTNDATTGALLNVGYAAAFNGWVVGITANLLAVLTHTLLALSPTIAAAEVASTSPLYRVSMAAATPSVITTMVDGMNPLHAFTKGQLIGCKITTDANLLPAGTADLFASVYVIYDLYQP